MQQRDFITFPTGWLLGSFGFPLQHSPLNLRQFNTFFKQDPVPEKKHQTICDWTGGERSTSKISV